MKVFWSWQSDHPGKIAHYLVRDAISDALAELSSELELEEANRPEVDHDTKGVSGSPQIVESILDKIDAAAAFVADVSPVGTSAAGKLLPNPNVMLELGYARKSLSLSRIVLVANDAHLPSLEHLPFDLKNIRGPITYNASSDMTSAQIKTLRTVLAGKLKDALRPILLLPKAGRSSRPGFRMPGASRWFSEPLRHSDGASHTGVELAEGARVFLKVLPTTWPSRVRTTSMLLRGDNQLGAGPGSYGSSTLNEDGFLEYWYYSKNSLSSIAKATYLAQWFRDTGEVWAIWSGPAINSADPFRHQELANYLFQTLLSATSQIQRLGGKPPFRVEVGTSGIKGLQWTKGLLGIGLVAVKDVDIVETELSSANPDEALAVVTEFWNALFDAFCISDEVTPDDVRKMVDY